MFRRSQIADSFGWKLAQYKGRHGLFKLKTLVGTPSSQDVPVAMCLWNRPARIDDILSQLDAQVTGRALRLILWNNQPEHDAYYRQRINAFRFSGNLASIEYFSSRRNVGGIGRFFLARKLLRSGYSGHFIMLDDDQDVTTDFAASLERQSAPRELLGWWAWNYLDSHWNRNRAIAGQEADYVGTGGSICDIELVRKLTFFTDLPRQFAFLEDQWACAYARSLGWRVRAAELEITFVLHETNQFHGLADTKNAFWEYLHVRKTDL